MSSCLLVFGAPGLQVGGLRFALVAALAATGWAGACFAGGCATSLGIGALYTKVQDAAKSSMPRSEVNRTPKEIAPFRPISDGRTPEKQAPAHLAARATPARAKRRPWHARLKP